MFLRCRPRRRWSWRFRSRCWSGPISRRASGGVEAGGAGEWPL